MTTTNMSLNEPSVGTTAGPTWATEVNENFTTIDQHDHTSGKGVQLTTSALNINADLEFNGNAATELKRLTIDSSATGSGTNYSVYQSGGNLFWYNGSGQAVQITDGSAVKTTGGSISGMSGNAAVQFSVNAYVFKWDTTTSPQSVAKISCSDISIYNFSNYNDLVTLKYTGSGASSELTLPDETGTLLSTATSFAGAISVGATGGSGSITLDAQTDINLDSDSGVINFKDGGTAIGKISNSSSDLVIENEVDAKDIIFKQYDGNEVVRMADDRRLYFYDKGGEYIYGDGSNLYLVAGTSVTFSSGWTAASQTCADLGTVTTADINGGTWQGTISGSWTAAGQTCADLGTVTQANINGGEIDGVTIGTNSAVTRLLVDNLELDGNTISSSNLNGDITIDTNGTGDINLTGGTNVNIPADIGLTFGDDGEKIEGDGTNLTIASSATLNINTGSGTGNDLKVNTSQLVVEGDTGYVGIGQNAPTKQLEVLGTATEIRAYGNSNSGAYASYGSSSGSNLFIGQENSSGGLGLGSGGYGRFIHSTGAFPLSIYTNATERIQVESGGDVAVKTGSLVISTAGQGIGFGSTLSNHTLDDYEELTSTIIDFGNASNGTNGLTNESRTNQHVTKIGDLVTISLRVTVTHQPNPGGTNGTRMYMRALPYTPVTNAGVNGWCRLVSGTGAGTANITEGAVYGADNPATDSWPIRSIVTPAGTSGTTTWAIFFQYLTSA